MERFVQELDSCISEPSLLIYSCHHIDCGYPSRHTSTSSRPQAPLTRRPKLHDQAMHDSMAWCVLCLLLLLTLPLRCVSFFSLRSLTLMNLPLYDHLAHRFSSLSVHPQYFLEQTYISDWLPVLLWPRVEPFWGCQREGRGWGPHWLVELVNFIIPRCSCYGLLTTTSILATYFLPIHQLNSPLQRIVP